MANKQPEPAPAKTGLELLREPFPPNQISKLPKPTKRQTDEVKQDFKKGIRCAICGTWHHPNVVHLDYVGHAALTDRLLDCDPGWNWEPVAMNEDGTPKLDSFGGMWIRLTVCGTTRLGYGHADNKTGGDAIKEVIGDALRNAAMRFGAALDLWHKGQLHPADDAGPTEAEAAEPVTNEETPFDAAPEVNPQHEAAAVSAASRLCHSKSMDDLAKMWRALPNSIKADPRVCRAKDERKSELSAPVANGAGDDPFNGGDEVPF